MLGITEAAIFGINLRFVKPFIAALPGGAAGGARVVSVHVYMTAVGLTAIPGMAIVQPTSLVNYIIGMVIAFALSLLASLYYSNTKRTRSNVDAFTNARDFTKAVMKVSPALADAHYPCWHLAQSPD